MMHQIMRLLEIWAAVTVAWCCICRLTAKQFDKHSPLAWSYALLGSSAIIVLCGAAKGETPHLGGLAAECGMAVYFLARSRTVRKLWRKHFKFDKD